MNILNELNEACNYIENNIENEIDIKEIARITNQSTDSINRFFVSMLGITIKEYIRKRRLSLAVYDLQNSDEKITDIAFKYGFNSYDSFCKAFLNQHNVTPTQAKNPSCEVNIFPPATFEINVKGAQKIKFKICDLEEFEVYGISKNFNCQSSDRFKQEKEMWSNDYEHYPEKICQGYDGIWYGIFENGKYSIARKKEDVGFDGLEKIIESRMDKSSIGFNADVHEKIEAEVGEMFHKVLPQDLIKFGLIPEFVGRVPVVVALDSLDEAALVRILKEPKNAILKQYQKLLAMDEVRLEFEDDALMAIAKQAKEKKVGARALRAIIEDFMLDIMYEIPKDDNIGMVTITKEYVEKKGGPLIEMRGVAALPEQEANA